MTKDQSQTANVCLILEGTYPYVPGGVSTWVHDLIQAQSDLTFRIVSIMPDDSEREPVFELPENVLGLSHVYIHSLPKGDRFSWGAKSILKSIGPHMAQFQTGKGDLDSLRAIMDAIKARRHRLGSRQLLNSEAAWEQIVESYNELFEGQSFIDYFWTWRGLMGGMLATLLADLPSAYVYHTISTGYAGLFAARAKIETGRPVILTEHGIYANERRIEITSASWLSEGVDTGLVVDKKKTDIREMWLKVFINYSQVCYAGMDLITTLYEGNQMLQRADGAEDTKLRIIPNGIDYDRFANIKRSTEPRRPAIALIGRVVPIKDVKTYIRACGILAETLPEFDAYIMGPTEEDPQYYEECREIVTHLGLDEIVTFTGRVKLDDYLGRIDAIVLTSISEAMPLVILEAGAASVPTIATDVGACREMIEGRSDEEPPLGPGGIITPLSNPSETASALARILTDEAMRNACGTAIQTRVWRYYNKVDIDSIYYDLYIRYLWEARNDAASKRAS